MNPSNRVLLILAAPVLLIAAVTMFPRDDGELADFAAAVLDDKALDAGPEQALGELRAALAIYRSAETGRWEPVWD